MISSHEDDIFYDGFGMRIWEKRHQLVSDRLQENKVKKVLDMGCNNAKLVQRLSRSTEFIKIDGVDICFEILDTEGRQNVRPETIQFDLASRRKEILKVNLFEGDILKKQPQLKNNEYDAITLIEVIEHIPEELVPKLNASIFGYLQPEMAIVTTPNSDFNVYFNFKNDQFRHYDHKFEWTQSQFKSWADQICSDYGYNLIELTGVGEHKTEGHINGYCSQVAIFRKKELNQAEQEKQISNLKIVYELEEGNVKEVVHFDYPFETVIERTLKKVDSALKVLIFNSYDYEREKLKGERYYVTATTLMNHPEIIKNSIINKNIESLLKIIETLDNYEIKRFSLSPQKDLEEQKEEIEISSNEEIRIFQKFKSSTQSLEEETSIERSNQQYKVKGKSLAEEWNETNHNWDNNEMEAEEEEEEIDY